MKKVYGYIRVSTAKQGEGVSLQVQKEAIIRYALQYQLNIIEWFEEKETAAKQGRPLFNKMMKLVREKKADGIIMHKIDRSARNLKDWADLGNLIDQGVDVHFAHESLDLQARGGRLSADIQAVIAADYVRNLRQEALKGLYGRLNQGIYPFGAPTGYLNAGKGKCKIADPMLAPWVKKIFELYAGQKYTLETLAAHNKKLGLGRQFTTQNGLSRMLNNPFYMGVMKVKGQHFNGKHEPLISPKLFQRVQSILNRKATSKGYKYDYKFRRLLSCQYCGYSLIAERQKGHIYYRCHTINCPTKCVRETKLEETILDTLKEVQLLPQEIAILHKLLNETEQDSVSQQEQLKDATRLQARQIESNLERLTDCYIEGGLDRETYEKRKGKLLTHLKKNEETEQQISGNINRLLPRVKDFLERAKSLVNTYKTGNIDDQRDLLDICTSNLEIAGKNLIIAMRSPYLEMSERRNLCLGEAERDTPRTKTRKACSRKQLEQLYQIILETLASGEE